MMDTSTDFSSLSPWWKHAAILAMIVGFSVLSVVTVLTYTNAPPRWVNLLRRRSIAHLSDGWGWEGGALSADIDGASSGFQQLARRNASFSLWFLGCARTATHPMTARS